MLIKLANTFKILHFYNLFINSQITYRQEESHVYNYPNV